MRVVTLTGTAEAVQMAHYLINVKVMDDGGRERRPVSALGSALCSAKALCGHAAPLPPGVRLARSAVC